jgi:hypothetical protein
LKKHYSRTGGEGKGNGGFPLRGKVIGGLGDWEIRQLLRPIIDVLREMSIKFSIFEKEERRREF